ncbi:zinc finger, CCHC-type containing protein [Tanacetum coccineum]
MSKDGLIPTFDMDTGKCFAMTDRGVEHSKAFRFYVIEPNDSVLINSIIESRDAIFDENRFSSVPRPSLRIPNGTEDIGGSVVPEEVTEEDVAFWKEAINDEMDSIMGKNTWVLADLPQVARINTIRRLIAIALIHNMIIHQMDVKTAFLNGDLEEEQTPKQWNQKFNEMVLSNGYLLNQADKCVYSKFNETVSTPMDTSEKLMRSNGQAVSQLEYSRVIGCLMYAMTCTRHDIAFAMGKLSRLTYTGYPSVLEGYTDASWISNTEDNSSTSGWVFLLGGGAISWASKKQTYITGSTMEYEFVALATAGKEAELLKNSLLEISLWSKPIIPISIRCDSAATLAKAYSQMYNGKSRHLGVRHHEWDGIYRVCEHMYLHIIPSMYLEPAEKEDEVVNFLMVNFFEKVLNRSMNKEEPPMYSNGLKGSILRTP